LSQRLYTIFKPFYAIFA